MCKEKTIEKIKQLMALAKDQSGRPEGEQAAKFAAEIMAKNNLSQEEIEEHGKEPFSELCIDLGGQSYWRRLLFHHIAKFCDSASLYISNSTRMYFYGRESNFEIAKYIYKIAERKINKDASAYYQEIKDTVYSGAKRLRTDFCMSAVDGFSSKLREMKKSAVMDTRDISEPHALILINHELSLADEFMRKERSVKSTSVSRRKNSSGYEAGKSISVRPGVSSGGESGVRGLLK